MAKLKEVRAQYQVLHPPQVGVTWAWPDTLAWLGAFDADEQAVFIKDLVTTVASASKNGRWKQVADLLDAWKETANERNDRDLQQRLRDARHELAAGGGYSWDEVRRDLAM
jgi:uncharacterized protein YfaQ (DUF2300 family)